MKSYTVPVYIQKALETLRPPEDISVSEWAERYRILDEKSAHSPGRWRNKVTPYLVGIMDELNNYETEMVVFCKPTQVGGTECIHNALGYIIDQDPAPTMLVYPTDKLGEANSENRIIPMLEASERLSEKYDRNNKHSNYSIFYSIFVSLMFFLIIFTNHLNWAVKNSLFFSF